MRLEPLYRVQFSYSGGWGADLAGQDSAEGRFFFLAEGRCEGRISGRFRGAIKRLKWRQEIIADYCRQLIDKIEALSIPEPVLRDGKKPKSKGTEHWWN